MTVATANQNGRVQLGSTDANIPLLAIQAANELDELVQGRKTEFQAVKRLAEVMKQSFPIESPSGGTAFVDSGTVAVLSQAMDELPDGPRASTMSELVDYALRVVKDLETFESASPTENLKAMRDFCIALASAASAYQQSIFEMAPTDPLRS